jgi:hypothetical protein
MAFFKKRSFVNLIPLISLMFLIATSAAAKLGDWGANLSRVKGNSDTGNSMPYSPATGDESDLAIFIGKIIWIGPFLGIVFIIQMVVAGYEWMTAGGDAKKVDDAKKRITNALIGMILFISLYVLSVFIIKGLVTVIG